jgi:hypothetical protein
MYKKCSLCLVLFCLATLAASAQSTDAIYSVRIAAFEKPFDAQSIIDDLGDLGILRMQESDKNVRVYLGNYLDKKTAQKVLGIVKKRKFRSAYIVSDSYLLTYGIYKYNSHTYQIGSFKHLNLNILNLLDDQIKKEIYLSYDRGHFRVSVGLYNPNISHTKDYAHSVAKQMGPVYQQGFDRQFRKVSEVPAGLGAQP